MKVSYNWLKEFLSIDLSPEELAERLTLSGAEVERVEEIVPEFTEVVVGRVVSAEPDGEKPDWSWCRVDIGEREVTTLCAAPNVRLNMFTAVMLPGGHPAEDTRVVEVRKIGDRVSEAMLCSEKELELGDNDQGIMELSDQLLPGQSLSEALELEDAILEIDLTPNRPDLLSHRGVARDIAALTGQRLQEEEVNLEVIGPPIGEDASVTILDYKLCPRYCARLIRGITVAQSPLWLRRRLRLCGINPVNNVVDATNYMLLELGHPLHAFDHNRLIGGEIIVRKAAPGEVIVTIDGDERELEPSMLVIADRENPVAVAGVMGGLHTEIGDATSVVLLESAYFDPVSIRRTSHALGMSSDASRRFERGADPLVADYALDRTAALIIKLAGGELAEGIIDDRERIFENSRVGIRPERTELLLGYPTGERKIIELLTSLELELEEEPEAETGRLIFKIPSWRPDLSREVDLIEEVARLTGFDKIPAVIPVSRITYQKKGNDETVRNRLRGICCGIGLDEVITYSFMSPGVFQKLRLPSDHSLRQACEIANPVNKEQGLLRTTLISGLLEIVERNMNQKTRQVNIFEIGRVFSLRGEDDPPREWPIFSLALFRRPDKSDWCREEPMLDFYHLKGILELIGQRMDLKGLDFIPTDHPVFQPGQAARIMVGDGEVGFAGTVADSILDNYSLPAPVYLAELDLSPFLKAGGRIPHFKSLGQYPAVRRDMTMVVDESVPYGKVRKAIENNRPDLMEKYSLFDLYRGDQIPDGKKSFAFSLQYRSSSDTLCETTIKNIHQAFLQSLIAELDCTFR